MNGDLDLFAVATIGLAAVLACVAGGALIAGVLAEARRSELERRYVRLVKGLGSDTLDERRGLRAMLVQVGEAWSSAAGDSGAARLLAQGGWRGRDAAALFSALRLLAPLAGVLGGGAAALLATATDAGSVALPALVVGGGLVGLLAPRIAVRARARYRMRRLHGELVPLAHLMRVLYEVGLSSRQVIEVLSSSARRVLPEMTRELAEINRLLAAGRSLPDASRDVTDGLALAELSDLFGMVRQTDRRGGSLREPLLDFAASLEHRERTRLNEVVSKLSAKLTIVMVLFLMPALLVFVGGPGFLAVIRGLRGGIGE